MKTAALFLLGIVCCASTVGTVAAGGELAGYTPEQIVDLYVDAALGSEVAAGRATLSKWPGGAPVKIYTFPADSTFNTGDRYREIIDLVDSIAEEVAVSLGPSWLWAPDADEMTQIAQSGKLSDPTTLDHSIAVFVGTRDELKAANDKLAPAYPPATARHQGFLRGAERNGTPLCYGIALPKSREAPDRLWRAWLYFEDTQELANCVYEDLLQAFGLFNDLPAGAPSIFNDDRIHTRPIELDWLLLRIHFDDRLEVGMDEAQVRTAALKVAVEMQNGQ